MTTVYDSVPSLSDFYDESGFPFDDTDDRGQRTRQRLDELAQRHPEFAEHLNPDAWGRRRTSSTNSGEDPFARFRNLSRFQDFDFDFSDFDDPQQFERFYPNQHPTQYQSPQQPPSKPFPQPQAQPQPAPQSAPQPTAAASKPPVAPESGKKIQQSNTVDLGQPQAPLVDESRTHRSMSAPPEQSNRAGGKRFVSSVNIPNVNAAMGANTSQPQQTQLPQAESFAGNPKERIIPIHVEGRDEVVTPSFTQTQHQQSQTEKIFGKRPSAFTQFVNTEPPPASDDLRPQADLRRQQQQHKYNEFMWQNQPQEVPPPQSQPPPPKPKPTSLELIQNIQKDVSELMTQVENFDGKPRDKKYLYLDEMLTRKMLLLDDIETGGQDVIRKARKEAIKCIQDTIKILDTKAQANEEAGLSAAQEPTPAPDVPCTDLAPEPTEIVPAEPPVAEAAVQTNPLEASITREVAVQVQKLDVPAPTEEKSNENQGLVIGGVVRSGSKVEAMDVEASSVPTQEQQTQPQTDDEINENGASEKKRVKKKAASK